VGENTGLSMLFLLECCLNEHTTLREARELYIHVCVQIYWKELEHRKMDWKGTYLKYDLGKSFSKEICCKMTGTKKILTTYYLKRWNIR